MALSVENAGALCPGASCRNEERTMEKLTIRVLRQFYHNNEILKVGTIVKDVPKTQALGYVHNRKAEIVKAPERPAAPPAPAKNEKDKEK